jgi:hypothetical protein
MFKVSRVLAGVGVAGLVFGGGVAVGAGGGSTVAGKPAQVQFLYTVLPTTPLPYSTPAPQPDTTPIPIAQTSVTVGTLAHAVVSVEVPGAAVYLSCAVGGAVLGHLVFVVDGHSVEDLGPTYGGYANLNLRWTPAIGPGTHTVALSLVCPAGSGDNPSDIYDFGPSPAAHPAFPVRVEVLKVP